MRTVSDLRILQALPLEIKVEKTKLRIREWYEAYDGEVYVSISGGKDSQVLAHIVKSMYPDVPCVFVNTGLEYDSVRLKGEELADTVLRPEMSFLEIVTKYGYPIISKEVSQAVKEVRRCKDKTGKKYISNMAKFNGEKLDKDGKKSSFNMDKYKFLLDAPFRIDNLCCNRMKKNPAKSYEKKTKQKPYIGTMAEESRIRKQKWLMQGCNAFENKRPVSQPLSFWTEQDILKYIKINNIKIAEIYGDIVYTDSDGLIYDNDFFNFNMPLLTTGVNRTGCVFCMFGIGQDKDRFLKLKDAEPKKYDYVMRGGKFDDEGMWIPHNGLGYKFVIDWLNEHGGLGIKY